MAKKESSSPSSSARPAAIVTGSGTGIGAAVCRRLGADGFAVLAAYSRSADGAQKTVDAIRDAGGTAEICRADVSSEDDVKALFAACLQHFGNLKVVINNAGIGHMAPFAKITAEDYERIFSTNAKGTFFMCREAARHIEDNGRVINISSGITVSSMPGMALYTASKLAMEGFSKALTRDLGPRGIAVNTLSPGMVDTPMLEGGDADALREYGAQTAAMKRLGQPEDIADAVGALVSEDCRWISGQNIRVCGGSVII